MATRSQSTKFMSPRCSGSILPSASSCCTMRAVRSVAWLSSPMTARACGDVGGLRRPRQPELQPGQRRAQLMRGHGGELPFPSQQAADPAQQAVQRGSERQQLARHAVVADRLQRDRRAIVPPRGDDLQRANGAAHREQDRQPGGDDQHEHRPHHRDELLRRVLALQAGLGDQHGDRCRVAGIERHARDADRLAVEVRVVGGAAGEAGFVLAGEGNAGAAGDHPSALLDAEIDAVVVVEEKDRLGDRRQIERCRALLETDLRRHRARGVDEPAIVDAGGELLCRVGSEPRGGGDDDEQRQHQPQQQIDLEPARASRARHHASLSTPTSRT